MTYGGQEIAAIGRARGLTVDVGACPACRERGGGWVWMKKPHADWPTGPGRWLARRSYRGFRVRFAKTITYLFDGAVQVGVGRVVERSPGERWWHAIEACPECTVTDAPSGRRVLAWEDAITTAMSTQCTCPKCADTPTVRAALTVMADQLQNQGDPLGLLVTRWLLGHVA